MLQFNEEENKKISKNIKKVSIQLKQELKQVDKNISLYINEELKQADNELQYRIKNNIEIIPKCPIIIITWITTNRI